MSSLLDFLLSQDDDFRRARLPSLYSDFSAQRYSNPDGYAANVATWTKVLYRAARAGLLPSAPGEPQELLTLNVGRPLLRSLETKEWGMPLGLTACFDDAIEAGQLVPEGEFISSPSSIYSQPWQTKPRKLLSWTLKQLGLGSLAFWSSSKSSASPSAQKYVVVPNVEAAGEKVAHRLREFKRLADRVLPMDHFRDEVQLHMGLNDSFTSVDLNILLKHLARDKNLIAYDDSVVRIKDASDPRTDISSQDRAIASLKGLMVDLERQTQHLTDRITECNERARSAVASKNKAVAMAALRSKKVAEQTLTQRAAVLTQLEEVYSSIEQAADQVAMVKVMQGSTEVLRSLRAETGGIDAVDAVVEGLRDEMSHVEEVSSAIEMAGQGGAHTVDEDAVDEELEGMLQQAKREESEAQNRRLEERPAEIPDITGQGLPGLKTDAPTVEASDQKATQSAEELPPEMNRLSLEEEPAVRPGDTHQQVAQEASG